LSLCLRGERQTRETRQEPRPQKENRLHISPRRVKAAEGRSPVAV
jgi:hypothetical protein